MKILQIEVQNYRLIKALMLELGGNNLAVVGDPGQGKTTAISLLWESLKMVGDPVTHGEKKGQIRITLGDGETEVFITRSFTAKTSPISITTSKGMAISAGEFASWFCNLGDNPQRIMQMKPTEQAAALLEAVELPDGIDLDQLDIDRKNAATERLNLKRDGERDAEKLGEEPEKTERVDVDALIDKENLALEANAERNRLKADIKSSNDILASQEATVAQKTIELERIKQEIKYAHEAVAARQELIKGYNEKLDKCAPESDESILRAQIQLGNLNNAKADTWDAWEAGNQALTRLRADYKFKDNEVKSLDKAKKEALAAAKWPLDGLSINDGVVVFNGSPLAQCGHSEQMLVCGALAAETIKNHKLHVVRMDGIESMSPGDFKRLSKIFNDKGIQVLSSRVTRGDIDDGELLIVDGEIK